MIELFESVDTIAIFIQWELREGPRNRKKKKLFGFQSRSSKWYLLINLSG
jgi:hypothetical protein